ncbi:MAG: hypothetical protein JXB26_02975 [Candidatus Aminicenantes bacterium]|nr:hypothetical protein [Candidatus Aminicenantes bacterium]
MKKFCVLAVLFCVVCALNSRPQENEYQYSDYAAMRSHVGKLFAEQKYMEAARILEWALEEYPDHVLANSYNLALMWVHLKEYEKSAAALQAGIDRGIWYGKYSFFQDFWEPMKKMESFQTVLTVCQEKMKEKQVQSKPEVLVLTPENYQKDKKYPLFIALHGGGGNIEGFKENWTSEKLNKKFIVLFVQSSMAVSMDGYNWTEDIEKSKNEIKAAYEKILPEYPIDTDKVIIGGFSSGGVASLAVVLDNTLPVAGFVVLCPAKPESFSRERVESMKNRGLRGTILTTEMDGRLNDQKEMAAVLKETGFDHRFIVTPNIGHWFPEDMNVKIDEAIEHILNDE